MPLSDVPSRIVAFLRAGYPQGVPVAVIDGFPG